MFSEARKRLINLTTKIKNWHGIINKEGKGNKIKQ